MKKVSTTLAKQSRKNSQQKLTIGLDLGDRSSHYCVLDESGGIVAESKTATSPKGDGGRVRRNGAEPDRARNGNAFTVGQPAAEPAWARSDRGAYSQRTADRGEPEERRSPGYANRGSPGEDRFRVAVVR